MGETHGIFPANQHVDAEALLEVFLQAAHRNTSASTFSLVPRKDTSKYMSD